MEVSASAGAAVRRSVFPSPCWSNRASSGLTRKVTRRRHHGDVLKLRIADVRIGITTSGGWGPSGSSRSPRDPAHCFCCPALPDTGSRDGPLARVHEGREAPTAEDHLPYPRMELPTYPRRSEPAYVSRTPVQSGVALARRQQCEDRDAVRTLGNAAVGARLAVSAGCDSRCENRSIGTGRPKNLRGPAIRPLNKNTILRSRSAPHPDAAGMRPGTSTIRYSARGTVAGFRCMTSEMAQGRRIEALLRCFPLTHRG